MKWYSFISVIRENVCGFLITKVVPIFACFTGNLRTIKNGITFAKNAYNNFFNITLHKRISFHSDVEYISNYKYRQ